MGQKTSGWGWKETALTKAITRAGAGTGKGGGGRGRMKGKKGKWGRIVFCHTELF